MRALRLIATPPSTETLLRAAFAQERALAEQQRANVDELLRLRRIHATELGLIMPPRLESLRREFGVTPNDQR